MKDYIDRTIIKLKRQYSKDELISVMIKEEKELKTEIGKLKSEKDELVYTVNRLMKIDKETKSRLCNLRSIKNLKNEVKALKEKLRKLKVTNQKVNSELIQCKINHERRK